MQGRIKQLNGVGGIVEHGIGAIDDTFSLLPDGVGLVLGPEPYCQGGGCDEYRIEQGGGDCGLMDQSREFWAKVPFPRFFFIKRLEIVLNAHIDAGPVVVDRDAVVLDGFDDRGGEYGGDTESQRSGAVFYPAAEGVVEGQRALCCFVGATDLRFTLDGQALRFRRETGDVFLLFQDSIQAKAGRCKYIPMFVSGVVFEQQRGRQDLYFFIGFYAESDRVIVLEGGRR